MKQNLTDLIMANRSFLKLNSFFDDEEAAILRFYLEKDIMTFLGKNEFWLFGEPDDEDALHFESTKDDENPKMIIECANEKYLFSGKKLEFCIRNFNNPNMYAFICYYQDTNSFVNDIHYIENDTIVHERHRIYVNKDKGYEYKRSVRSEDGKLRYPICHMRLMSQDYYDNKYYEIFSLCKDENSIIKKLIDCIKEHSIKDISETPDEYLDNIFKIMEQKTMDLKNEKKLTRIKNIAKY